MTTTEPLTVCELARMALHEGGHPELAPLLIPTKSGDPSIGMLGFMAYPDRLAVAKACILAHDHAGNEFATLEDGTRTRPEQLARWIEAAGSWRQIARYGPPDKHDQLTALALAYAQAKANP